MNARLRKDREGTEKKYGRLALKENLVRNTWERLLKEETNLPKDWVRRKKVLVGIDPEIGTPPKPGKDRAPH